MKRVAIMICFLLLIAFSEAHARIETERDAFDDSVSYKSTRKVTKWDTVDFYEFIKNIDASANEKYWIRFSDETKLPFNETAELIIDDTVFKIKKLDLLPSIHYRVSTSYPIINIYVVPFELIEPLKKHKSSIKFRFTKTGKASILAIMPEANREEIREIIGLTTKDFEEVRKR